MASLPALSIRSSATLPKFVAALCALACLGLGWQMLGADRHIAPPIQTSAATGVRPFPSEADHAQSVATAHIFGTAAPTPAAAEVDESSQYKVTGIACVGDTTHCVDQRVAVATLTGPDGDTVVHVGSALGAGTVTHIDPYLVEITTASSVQDLKFEIPAATLDERNPVIPVEGSETATVVLHAKVPEARVVLNQNMAALQTALHAAQAQRKALEQQQKAAAAKASKAGSGPAH